MFATAKTLKTKKTAKTEKKFVHIDGLEQLAALDQAIKYFSALKATLEADVKSAINIEFINAGAAAKSRPQNFEGSEGIATASCQLKARSSASSLTSAEIEVLEAHNIPVDVTETVAETFVINPAYKDDQAVLSKVEKALKKIKDLPEDFILAQEGVSKTVVGGNALDTAFATLDAGKLNEVLPLISTLAIRPKLASEDINVALDLVSDLINA